MGHPVDRPRGQTECQGPPLPKAAVVICGDGSFNVVMGPSSLRKLLSCMSSVASTAWRRCFPLLGEETSSERPHSESLGTCRTHSKWMPAASPCHLHWPLQICASHRCRDPGLCRSRSCRRSRRRSLPERAGSVRRPVAQGLAAAPSSGRERSIDLATNWIPHPKYI